MKKSEKMIKLRAYKIVSAPSSFGKRRKYHDVYFKDLFIKRFDLKKEADKFARENAHS